MRHGGERVGVVVEVDGFEEGLTGKTGVLMGFVDTDEKRVFRPGSGFDTYS